jgi:fengycin family lipopeptide synthetase D
MYTSGTTGQPKGVLVEHRNIIALVDGFFHQFGEKHSRVTLQQYPSICDGINEEVYTTLLSGSEMVIINNNEISNIPEFAQILAEYKVDTVCCSVALYAQIASHGINPKLELLIVSGDVMRKEYTTGLCNVLMLCNRYGTTEVCTSAAYYILNGNEKACIPIGKPLCNYTIHIMDEFGMPKPIGAVGEICIGGAGVCRGYLNQDELAAQQFIYNTFYQERLFKTGDLGRLNENNDIEFLGRMSSQVKICGYRISATDVETIVLQYPGVRGAMVLPCGLDGQDRELCCYLEMDGELHTQELKKYLTSRLPVYMIPAYFVKIPEIPYSMHGKVDIARLPAPDRQNSLRPLYIEPRTQTEKLISEIYGNVLGVESIGVNDNFFDTGGDLVKVVELQSKMSKKGLTVDLIEIMDNQDVSSLAKALETKGCGC